MSDYSQTTKVGTEVSWAIINDNLDFLTPLKRNAVVDDTFHAQIIGIAIRNNALAVLAHYLESEDDMKRHFDGALREATTTGKIQAFKYLLERNPESVSLEGCLVEACSHRHTFPIIQYLVEERHVNPLCSDGQSIKSALLLNDERKINYLLNHSSDIPESMLIQIARIALIFCHIPSCDIVFHDRHFVNVDFNKLLTYTITQNKPNGCRYIFSKWSDRITNIAKAWHWAVCRNNLPILKILRENGADVDCRDAVAIKTAVATRNLDMFTYLHEQGANIRCVPAEHASFFADRYPQTRQLFYYFAFPNFPDEVPNIPPPSGGPSANQDNSRKRTHEMSELDVTRNMLLNRLADDDACPVCLETLNSMPKTDIVFWPKCAHMICKTCKLPLEKCPMCRS